MYGLLLTKFSPRIAGWLCAAWYGALLAAIVALSVEAPADFRYARY